MKTKVCILAAVLFLAAGSVFGIGLGLQGDAEFIWREPFTGGLALAISPSRLINLALSWHFGDVTVIGATADAQALNLHIVDFGQESFFGFTLGAGLFFKGHFGRHIDFDPFVGLRIPVGFNLMLGNVVEIYAHVAPSFGLEFYPDLGTTGFFYPAALGARFWFGE